VKVVIMGCGRVGARVAETLSNDGHEVTIIDVRADAFRRLPSGFKGKRHVGNGIDSDVLARIGLGDADVFIAATQGDNRNVMATQMAKHIFGVPRTLCRVYDPIREEMYRELGLETISPTIVGANLFVEKLYGGEAPQMRGAGNTESTESTEVTDV
jgi:trk system potassium uptake protein